MSFRTCQKGNFNIFSFADKTQRTTKNKGKFTRTGETEHTSSDYWGSVKRHVPDKMRYIYQVWNLCSTTGSGRDRWQKSWKKWINTRYWVATSLGVEFWIFVIVTVWFWSLCCLNLYHGVWTPFPHMDIWCNISSSSTICNQDPVPL